MTIGLATCWGAAFLSIGLALAVVLLGRRSVAACSFGVGLVLLAAEALLVGLSLAAGRPEEVQRWQAATLLVQSALPAAWLVFSLSYSRGDVRGYVWRWRLFLAGAVLLPVGVVAALFFGGEPVLVVKGGERPGEWWVRYVSWGRPLQVVVLVAMVWVLANLERTFRAAVGTIQWRIKFVFLGLGLIFGARIYAQSQSLLFANYDLKLGLVTNSALILGCALMVVGYLRRGFSEIDIYPSRTVLQGSVVVVLVGLYLFVVGVLAQLARLLGGTGNFQFQVLVILAGLVVLAILLLSDRLRQKLQAWISRHFRRPQHDSRAVWTLFARRLSSGLGLEAYGGEAVRLIASTFNALSVTLWLSEGGKSGLVFGASTAQGEKGEEVEDEVPLVAAEAIVQGIVEVPGPFDLEQAGQPWAESLRHLSLRHFRDSGNRVCLPLLVGRRPLGLIIIADRVNAVPYSVEEMDLLGCIADHVAAGLLQLRLTEELMHGRELEAFQAMSTFFVHDLKNAASSLSLMLRNLPEHFDDPAFREDALRGIGSTVGRINQIIERLGSLRQKLELRLADVDLNDLVDGVLAGMGGLGDVELVRSAQPLPKVRVDPEQLTTVVTNLLLNAREAVGRDGRIEVGTSVAEGRVVFTVRDNGVGMSAEYVRDSLFRPFQTTKKRGLGIGMFQSKLIVEAHQGLLQVQSAPGLGTTFRLLLPLTPTLS